MTEQTGSSATPEIGALAGEALRRGKRVLRRRRLARQSSLISAMFAMTAGVALVVVQASPSSSPVLRPSGGGGGVSGVSGVGGQTGLSGASGVSGVSGVSGISGVSGTFAIPNSEGDFCTLNNIGSTVSPLSATSTRWDFTIALTNTGQLPCYFAALPGMAQKSTQPTAVVTWPYTLLIQPGGTFDFVVSGDTQGAGETCDAIDYFDLRMLSPDVAEDWLGSPVPAAPECGAVTITSNVSYLSDPAWILNLSTSNETPSS